MNPGRALLLLAALVLAPVPARAQNPTMSDDFTRIIGWLSAQTAQSLGFNAGSTFDPPNEMRPWRIQPDVSLGIGVMPFDKGVFPKMEVEALAEKDPAKDLPNDVKFPNLTVHSRMGLPWRMDLGVRLVNMTIPKGYRLSETTKGDGQSNTIGVALRKHFLGGGRPLVSVSGAYNKVNGYFNFANEFNNVELAPGFFASSKNTGQLDWSVQSLGVNVVVSQAYGRWTPFLGAGFNRVTGSVKGKLEANWLTPLIQPSVGRADNAPEAGNSRVIFGFQRDGSFWSFFLNGEAKASGFAAGKAFVISTGFAAPFKIGANSSIVRGGRNKLASELAQAADDEPELMPAERLPHSETRIKRYWLWGREKDAEAKPKRAEPKPKPAQRQRQDYQAERRRPGPPPAELIFIR